MAINVSEDIIQSVNYQITVEGHLDTKWSSRLSGLTINYIKIKNTSFSTLTGQVRDQAALNGVLNTLFNQRMKVISVLELPNSI